MTKTSGTTFNLLFVCSGNTCRSPMAEAVARRAVAERGWKHVQVRSAGTGALAGLPASAEAEAVSERRGLDLSGHHSRPLSRELVAWADLILAMTPGHLDAIIRWGGEGKSAVITDFAGEDRWGIRDPVGQSEAVYEETLVELEELVEKAVSRIEPLVSP